MDNRLLKAFTVVVEKGSISHAAEALGLSQPAVSAQMARLELEIGFKLFERTGNRVKPTPEGIAFHGEAIRTMGAVEDLNRRAESIRYGVTGNLVVIAHPSSGISLLPGVIAEFGRHRPDVRVQLQVRDSDIVRSSFPSRVFDVGIAELPMDITGLDIRHYGMECVAILPSQHPLAQHKVITPKLLHGEPFIGMLSQRSIYHKIRNVFAQYNSRLNIVAEVEFFASICQMVREGLGVSIVDAFSAVQFSGLGVVVRPFEPRITYDLAIFWSKPHETSIVMTAFLDILTRHIGRFSDFPRQLPRS